MDTKPGALIAGRFRVDRVLDEDDGALILSTRETTNGLLVAVKVFPASTPQSRVISRFRRAQNVDSPYVPKLFELGGLEDGRTFVAMEHLNGRPLSERVARGPLAIGDAVLAVKHASLAIAAAHRAGVVHRRVATRRLLETKGSAERPSFRLLGLATVSAASEVDPAELPTDLEFVAPEQLAGIQHGDRPADIWALGVIFYQLLTGRLPFTGLTRKAISKQIVSDDPKPPRSFRPDAPWQLEQAILRCLDKKPAARFESADELVTLLESFAVLSEPPPHPTSSPSRKPSASTAPSAEAASSVPAGHVLPADLPKVAKLGHLLSGTGSSAEKEYTPPAFRRLRGDGQIEEVKIEDAVGMARARRIDSQPAELRERASPNVQPSTGPRLPGSSGAPPALLPSEHPPRSLSTASIVATLIAAAIVLGLLSGLLLRALLR